MELIMLMEEVVATTITVDAAAVDAVVEVAEVAELEPLRGSALTAARKATGKSSARNPRIYLSGRSTGKHGKNARRKARSLMVLETLRLPSTLRRRRR